MDAPISVIPEGTGDLGQFGALLLQRRDASRKHLALVRPILSDDRIQAVTMDQISKRGRGRPRKHGEAMTGRERQSLYAKARQRDMARVAYALKDILTRTKANQKAFSDSYQGTTSGQRLRRGMD